MTKVKRLLAISIDAMFAEDFEFMKSLPNFGPLLKNASRVVNVRSVYPSLTYPCHATMITGVYPDKHMVAHNEEFIPGEERLPWLWFRNRYKNWETVPELARQHGYSVGVSFWPAGGGLKVDWNLHRTWSFTGEKEKDYEGIAVGSTIDFLEEVWPVLEPAVLRAVTKADYDEVYNIGLCEMIRRKKPEVLFQHVSNLDHIRHRKGIYAPEVYNEAWVHHDRLFGEVLEALREIGELDNTTIVLTSDHGQTPVDYTVSPNILLVRDGLIRLDSEGKLVDWDAYFFSAGHSCQIYLKDPQDVKLHDQVIRLVKQYEASGELVLDRIISKEEAKKEYHLEGDFSFIMEAADGIAFKNNLTGELVAKADNSNYKYSVATHGHLPEKGPQPTFILCGANVKPNVIVEQAQLVDIAPTIAALLGFEMNNIDGEIIRELI